MLEWITQNLGNIIVLSIVILICALAIRSMIRSKDESSNCGGECSGCGNSEFCHPKKNGENALVTAFRQDHPRAE